MPAPQIVPSTQVAIFSAPPPMPAPVEAPAAPKPPPRPSRPGAKRQMDEMFATIDIDDGDAEDGPLPVAPDNVSLQVMCNDVYGLLNPATCKVVHKGQTMTATQFEAFAGSGSAKKWKSSLRIVPGQVPECPHGAMLYLLLPGAARLVVALDVRTHAGAQPMAVGKWLDLRGWVAKGSRQGKPKVLLGVTSTVAQPPAAPPQPKESAAAAAPKPPKEEGPPPWERMQQGNFNAVAVKWSGDRCAVCSSEVDYDTDQLIHCHGCGVAVHQSCYGVRELPQMEDKWVCSACEAVLEGQPRPHCAVCPVEGGALKPTTLPGVWCHVACMQVRPLLPAAARHHPAHRISLHALLHDRTAAATGRAVERHRGGPAHAGVRSRQNRGSRAPAVLQFRARGTPVTVGSMLCSGSRSLGWSTRTPWSRYRAWRASPGIAGVSSALCASSAAAPRSSATSAAQRFTRCVAA